MGSVVDEADDETDETGGSNRGEKDGLYAEMWHACAGPHVYVPCIEEKVYYFLQGHMEQVEAYMNQEGKMEMPVYNLPSKILCKVVHVHLKAEPDTDEVFAQITLLPLNKQDELSSQDENFKPVPPRTNSRLFSKILTPSDTSTHGGFSAPRRQAEECLPPLDMSQRPPVQELVAKDLHGNKWHFRHIFRGQPKRHLLTSGWSTFVSSKKLVAGDECIFLRGENEEIRVGVRRATKLQNNVSPSVISGLSMKHGILASALHAISTGTMFTVYYRPWTSPSEFIISFDQYLKSAKIDCSVGTRFRMKLDGQECPENKSFGTVVGVQDFDHIRWPGSEWRRLEVQWNDTPGVVVHHPETVSPWNIEPTELANNKHISDSPRQKRSREVDSSSSPGFSSLTKDGLQKSKTEPYAKRVSVFEVSQGQEDMKKGLHESDHESEGSQSQPNGCSKYMLFGVNLNSIPLELPSPQFATSCGLQCPSCTVSPISQSNISETVQSSEPSKRAYGVLLGKKCKNSCFFSNRSCTKVLKYGTALGRSVDLTRFNGYDELTHKLDKMFDFKGSLIDESSGWLVTYTNGTGNMMLIGDYPWQMFRSMVQRMFIYPKEEIDRLNPSSPESTSIQQ